MTKRLSAVVGEYTDKQTNQQKADWQNIGVIVTGKNGKDYVLLDPAVNLAGVLLKQNVLAAKKGENPSDMVMSSLFEEQQGTNQNNNQGQQQNNQQNNSGFGGQHQQYNNQGQNQGGFNNNQG